MPTYDFRCEVCNREFDRFMPMSRCDDPQSCAECGAPNAKRIVTAGMGFILKGDDWAGKNIRIAGQMRDKNKRLDAKQNDVKRDIPSIKLAPNVDGERVDSWAEAQKLAASKGKDATSYDGIVRKEQSNTK